MDRDKFGEKFVRALRRAGLDDVQYDSELFQVRHGEQVINLHNAWADCERASFFRRGGVVRKYVDILRSLPKHTTTNDFDQARPNLLPYVRDVSFWAQLDLMRREQAPAQPGWEIPRVPLGGDLVVSLTYDTETSMSTVNADQLKQWGVTLDEALKTAHFNLRMRTRDGLAEVSPGLHVSPYQDNHDASRIVLTDLISRLNVKGDPVVLVPHRDQLIVTGSEDADGLAEAARMALEVIGDNRRVSGTAVRFAGGGWSAFVPGPGSRAGEPLRRLRMLAMGSDYAQQQELLQRLDGADVYVASYSVLEPDGGGGWISYTVWTEGVPTLLPLTDMVAFTSERWPSDDPRAGLRPWSAVEDVAPGLLIEEDGLVPARVRTTGFPTDEMLEAIADRLRAP